MTATKGGWIIFAAALGMMTTLLSADVRALHEWKEMFMPSFIANAMAHFGTVVAAFVGGKIMPTGDKNG